MFYEKLRAVFQSCRDAKIDHHTQCHGEGEHLLARAKNKLRKELKNETFITKPRLTNTQSLMIDAETHEIMVEIMRQGYPFSDQYPRILEPHRLVRRRLPFAINPNRW